MVWWVGFMSRIWKVFNFIDGINVLFLFFYRVMKFCDLVFLYVKYRMY